MNVNDPEATAGVSTHQSPVSPDAEPQARFDLTTPHLSQKRRAQNTVTYVLANLLLLLLLLCIAWFSWLFYEIHYYAHHDQARAADVIAVFGAAEYDGHPSPVLRARLDQALVLYHRGLAPMIVTLGGQGDARHSEGSVGRDYLVANGVPESHIIAETRSNNTESSAKQLAIIARANQLNRIIAVSDGTHLFRIHALCAQNGLDVFTSPRAPGRAIGRSKRFERLAHEMLSYSLWRLGL
jgi:uncharacterized SAM-binding protein YcdF (DUF218 family)